MTTPPSLAFVTNSPSGLSALSFFEIPLYITSSDISLRKGRRSENFYVSKEYLSVDFCVFRGFHELYVRYVHVLLTDEVRAPAIDEFVVDRILC